MAQRRSVKPDGFVIYGKTLQSVLLLPDESAGRVLKAAACFFLIGETPEGLALSEEIVFSLFTSDINSALAHHAEVCARNQRIAANRKAPDVTSRDDSSPSAPNREELNQKELNLNESETREKKADTPPRAPRFTPPSVEEVAAYCRERQNHVDVQRFVDFYASNGWKVGKNPMRDWKAAVRTWEGRDGRPDIQSPNRYEYREGSL